MLGPVLGDLDSLAFDFFLLGVKSLITIIFDDLSHLSRVQRVENVEEERPINLSALRKLVREVSFELEVVLVVLVQVFDAQLWIVRDCDLLHVGNLEQLFALSKDVLEEVFGDVANRRHVVLDYLSVN